jgi:hypothetical protein
MKKTLTFLAILFFLTAVVNLKSFAGKIENLNINAKGQSEVKIKTNDKQEIKNINIKKDPESKININNKKVDCNKEGDTSGFCTFK